MPENDTTPDTGDTTTTDQQPDATDQDHGTRPAPGHDAPPDPEHDKQTSTKTFTQADIDRIVAERVTREQKKYADYADLKKAAAKLAKIEDDQKTEVEKLGEQLSAAQVELQSLKVEKTRRDAASTAGLDPDLTEYITAVDPDEALAQATKLAEKVKAREPKPADMRQGTRTTARPPESRDELIRRMAGFQN
jgi:hypothetical protein